MSREVRLLPSFEKDLQKLQKQNKDITKLSKTIELLRNDIVLPKNYYDHKLNDSNYYKNCRECHIEPDWLLIYRKEKDKLILILVASGSHSYLSYCRKTTSSK